MPDTSPSKAGERLRTPWVFIDTQAFRSAGLNWTSRPWSKFAELARNNVIRPVTTSITRREVERRLAEALTEAENAANRNRAIFLQLGSNPLGDGDFESRRQRLLEAFDDYVKKANFLEIEIKADVTEVFDDYFAGRAPFGAGSKKAEFPDAFVLRSLRHWLGTGKASLYVVSGDNDLKSFCDGDDRLIHVGGLNAFLSTAQAHGDLLDALEQHVRADKALIERIHDTLNEYRASPIYDVDVDAIEFADLEISSVLLIDEDEAQNEYLLEVEVQGMVKIDAAETSYEMVLDRDGEPDVEMRLHQDRVGATTTFYVETTVRAIRGGDEARYETTDWYFSPGDIDIRLPFGFNANEVRLRR